MLSFRHKNKKSKNIADTTFKVQSVDQRIVWILNNYLQRSIFSNCRSQKYLQIEKPHKDKKSIWKLNNYLQIDKHIKKLSTDWSIIWRLNNYLQTAELYADQGIIYRPTKYLVIKKCLICRSNNYLKMKELSADWIIIYILKNNLQIKDISICKSKYYLQIYSVYPLGFRGDPSLF